MNNKSLVASVNRSNTNQITVDKILIEHMSKDQLNYERVKNIFDKYSISKLQSPLWLTEDFLKNQFNIKLVQAKKMVASFKSSLQPTQSQQESPQLVQTPQYMKPSSDDKVLILIGEFHTGKTTLIQFLYNYLANSIQQNIKYSLKGTQKGSFQLYIIELPSYPKLFIYEVQDFGTNVKSDQSILQEMQELIGSLDFINLICFTFQANNIRLTDSQNYLMSLFFNHLTRQYQDNIIVFLTFSDGSSPQIIQSLQEESCIWKKCILSNSQPWYFAVNCQTLYQAQPFDGIAKQLFQQTEKSLSSFLCKLIVTDKVSTNFQKQLNQSLNEINKKELTLNTLIKSESYEGNSVTTIIKIVDDIDYIMERIKPQVLNINFGYHSYLQHQISMECSQDSSRLRYLNHLLYVKDHNVNKLQQGQILSEIDQESINSEISKRNYKKVRIEYWSIKQISAYRVKQLKNLIGLGSITFESKQLQEFKLEQLLDNSVDIIILNLEEVPNCLYQIQEQINTPSRFLFVTSTSTRGQERNFIIIDPEENTEKYKKTIVLNKINCLNFNLQQSDQAINIVPRYKVQSNSINKIVKKKSRILVQSQPNSYKQNQQSPIKVSVESIIIFHNSDQLNEQQGIQASNQNQTIRILLLTQSNHNIREALKDSSIYIQDESQYIRIQDQLIDLQLINQHQKIEDIQPHGIIYTLDATQLITEYQQQIPVLLIEEVYQQEDNQSSIEMNSQEKGLQLKLINNREIEFSLNSTMTLRKFIQKLLSEEGEKSQSEFEQNLKWLFFGLTTLNELRQISSAFKNKFIQDQHKNIQFLYKNISYEQEQQEAVKFYEDYLTNKPKCLIYIPCFVIIQKNVFINWLLHKKIFFIILTPSSNKVYLEQVCDKDNMDTNNFQCIYTKPQQSYAFEETPPEIIDNLFKPSFSSKPK